MTRTFIYTYPIDGEPQRAAVEAALEQLSTELMLTHPLRLKGGHRGLVTVPGVDPDDTWAAMDRVVPDWPRIFLPPTTA